ncbi:hypothetical protein MHPYR_220099 [uncultured Mycobacterium sp.]|uniref:Uncharacterized protein n=1 Tax=uncultured Mycobacterium sp. TaxID=171292 RepID=A0A1Y5PDL7_9MYCO|nr:hypothetical protein MHPYR_220099 [uncultured Mycobacterium sp.]
MFVKITSKWICVASPGEPGALVLTLSESGAHDGSAAAVGLAGMISAAAVSAPTANARNLGITERL